MDTKHYHVPIHARPVCPVCKKAVYSRGGIHPQCAMIQADPLRPIKKIVIDPAKPVVAALSVQEQQEPVGGGTPAVR
jgi:hypothetical protein